MIFLVRMLISITKQSGPHVLKRYIQYFGNSTTDLYTGNMHEKEIAAYCLDGIKKEITINKDAYEKWIVSSAGCYQTIILPDNSEWILKIGNIHGRYVHIHPGRNVPHTVRVKANVLKTCFFVQVHSRLSKKDPLNIDLINQVRKDILNLSPIKFVTYNHELGRIIDLFSQYLQPYEK